MEPSIVEDLFLVPLSNERELERALKDEGSTIAVESAQHTFAEILVSENDRSTTPPVR